MNDARFIKPKFMQRIFLRLQVLLLTACTFCCAGSVSKYVDLTELPIEKLMDMQVSILKGNDTLSTSPAAISVITQEDIRRSGAASIPEALRLVPGLEVARANASQWAISSRGFNDIFANKLLVLQDGRSIYSPLFSGVPWDIQGAMLEDIDRIEVIRGSGATLWGPNAVNGVINIISKSAKETQGWLISGGGGTEVRGFTSGRYGGKIGDNVYFRAYGMYFDHRESVLPDGHDANDAWRMGRWGGRLDWDVSERNLLTLQGDVYVGELNQTFTVFNPANPPTLSSLARDKMQVRGGNMLSRWTHTFSDTAEMKLQFYYDRQERDAIIFREKRDTVDLDMGHRFEISPRNSLIWGASYRFTADKLAGSPTVSFNPSSASANLFSAFVQHEMTLVPDRLRLMLGSKFEHNDFTGTEFEPGGRLIWTPNHRNTLWASVSRAVRTPSRADDASTFNQPLQAAPNFFVPVTIHGTNTFQSEELLAYEIGYRVQPCDKLSFDLALFYNDYAHLRSVAQQSPLDPTHFYQANDLHGKTHGMEATATVQMNEWWRLQPSYTLLQMKLHARADNAGQTDNTSVQQAEGSSPQNQFSIRSFMDLPHEVSFDCILRYVDTLPAQNVGSYVTMDVRLGWRATKNLELSIVGQNLFQDQHAEFGPSFTQAQQTEVPRSFYGKITWRF